MARSTRGYPYQLADIVRGELWQEDGPDSPAIKGTVRILGVVDGYVVFRKKGAAPFLMFWKDFVLQHRRVPGTSSDDIKQEPR